MKSTRALRKDEVTPRKFDWHPEKTGIKQIQLVQQTKNASCCM